MVEFPGLHLLFRLVGCLAFTATVSSAETSTSEFASLSISQLEARLQDIDEELASLANYSLRSGIGAIGYRSAHHGQSEVEEWIEIDLGEPSAIDEVVLVPTIWRDTNLGFQADAFPIGFRILAGTKDDPTGQVIADSDSYGALLPRIAPLRISTPGIVCSWIRIEARELTIRAFDNEFVFQLAEVLVFNQEENLALNRPLRTSSNINDGAGAWDQRFLVDGFMPYLMDAAKGSKSLAYVSQIGTIPTLMVDLGETFELSRVHLHSVDQSDTVPQAYAGDLGIPGRLKIESALYPDFSDARLLLDFQQERINDTGPIITRRFPATPGRYVRFIPEASTNQPFQNRPDLLRVGFAEIELFSAGENVALGRTMDSLPQTRLDSTRSLSALTDGRNLYGEILSTRTWLNELAQRHALERERPLVSDELNRRYIRQQSILHRTSWLAAALAVGIGFVILFEHNLRLRQAARMRQRFAADLHDELGANLHTIGLLCDLAKDSIDSRQELLELLDRTRVFTERSGTAARYCSNMLEAKGLCDDLVDEMKRSSSRLLSDLDHDLVIEGEAILKDLSPRKRIDLFFFYKESLTNIIRHSGATRVSTRLTATPKAIHLSITDNGHGIAEQADIDVPPSLKRRARLLSAKVSMERPAEGGTRIMLDLKDRKWKCPKYC